MAPARATPTGWLWRRATPGRLRGSQGAGTRARGSRTRFLCGSGLGAKDERVPLLGPVDDVGGDLQLGQDLPQAPHVVADLFGEEPGLGPGPVLDLVRAEVAMRAVEQE